MDINSLLNVNSSSTTGTEDKTKSERAREDLLGTREDFLTLLLAQLKHQDPLAPMEGTEFIDSITRLSSVEQDVNQNQHLEEIVSLLKGEKADFGSPVSYLGREVDFQSSAIELSGDGTDFAYDVGAGAKDVFITIRNQKGAAIYTASGDRTQGRHVFDWDGLDKDGNPQKDGIYFLEVNTKGESDKLTPSPTYASGEVTGVNFEGDEAILNVGGIPTKLDKVISIRSDII